MTVEEIFKNIASHFLEGLSFHRQEAAAYGFLQLCGYQSFHEHQYIEESENYLRVINFYLSHYRKLLPEFEIKESKVIPQNWYKHLSEDVDISTKRSAIDDLMKKWISWEIGTKNLLEKSYKELLNLDEVKSSLFISEFLLDVDEEIIFARKELDNLQAINYDMSVIIPEQKELHKEYAE